MLEPSTDSTRRNNDLLHHHQRSHVLAFTLYPGRARSCAYHSSSTASPGPSFSSPSRRTSRSKTIRVHGMTPFVTSLDMPGCRTRLNGISLFGGSLTLRASKDKKNSSQGLVNERKIIIQKGDLMVGRSSFVLRQRQWWALAALDRQRRR